MITITKVVSNNLIEDFIASIQNMLGFNLTSYEKMVEKGIKQIRREIKKKDLKLKWFRYETSQLTNGAIAIILYGEVK